MTLTCAVTRFAAPTSTGSQNITTDDLGGLTPKAVIFIGTNGITDGTAAAHTQMSFGAATGATNEWCTSSNSEDAQTTTDTDSELVSDGCILFHTPGTSTDTAKADFTTFITDGVTLNWSVVDAAFLITAIFFAGSDLSAHANFKDLGDTLDNAVDITDPGFEPDIVIASILDGRSVGGSGGSDHSIGFCSNDGAGGIVQRCLTQLFRAGQATSSSAAWTTDDATVRAIRDNGNADWRGVLGTFDSNGFTCTTAIAGANGTDLVYLALNFGGRASSFVGTHTAPTSTGENGDTGPGFKPQLVMRLMTQVATANNEEANGDASGTWGGLGDRC